MSDKNSINDFTTCDDCGASLPPGVARCWLCSSAKARKDDTSSDNINPYASPVEIHDQLPRGFSLATVMLFVTLFAVVCGVYSIAPGLGVPLALLAVIPFVRTAILVKARAEQGIATSWMERFSLGAISALVLIAMCVVVQVSMAVGLFVTCWVAIGSSVILGPLAGVVAIASIIATLIGSIAIVVHWAKIRWQHDCENP